MRTLRGDIPIPAGASEGCRPPTAAGECGIPAVTRHDARADMAKGQSQLTRQGCRPPAAAGAIATTRGRSNPAGTLRGDIPSPDGGFREMPATYGGRRMRHPRRYPRHDARADMPNCQSQLTRQGCRPPAAAGAIANARRRSNPAGTRHHRGAPQATRAPPNCPNQPKRGKTSRSDPTYVLGVEN